MQLIDPLPFLVLALPFVGFRKQVDAANHPADNMDGLYKQLDTKNTQIEALMTQINNLHTEISARVVAGLCQLCSVEFDGNTDS